MFKKSKKARLLEIWADGLAVAWLGRLFATELARFGYESVDIRRRVRLSQGQRRALGLGALAAVGLTSAGVVARRAFHGSDDPEPVT